MAGPVLDALAAALLLTQGTPVTLAQAAPVRVTGVALEQDGGPLAAAVCAVSLGSQQGSEPIARASADAEGRFDLEFESAADRVDVVVDAPGRVPKRFQWPMSGARQLELGEVRLPPPAEAAIVLLDDIGNLEGPGWSVEVDERHTNLHPYGVGRISRATHDPDRGVFLVEGLDAGLVMVVARHFDGTKLDGSLRVEAGAAHDLVLRREVPPNANVLTIEVAAQLDEWGRLATLPMIPRYSTSSALRPRVFAERTAGARVELSPADEDRRGGRRSAGLWVSDRVPSVPHRVRVEWPGLEPREVLVEPGRTETIVLPGASSLALDVRGAAAREADDWTAALHLGSPDAGLPLATTDPASGASFVGIVPARYHVRASASGFRDTVSVVDVSGADPGQRLTVWLEPPGRVLGQVVGPDAEPLADKAVELWTLGFDARRRARARTDGAGRFELPFEASGAMELRAIEAGGTYASLQLRCRGEQVECRLSHPGERVVEGRVDLPAGTATSGLSIALIEVNFKDMLELMGSLSGGSAASVTWQRTSQGRQVLAPLQVEAPLGPDGTFRFDAVLATERSAWLVRTRPRFEWVAPLGELEAGRPGETTRAKFTASDL